jgi:hypothetical protein
VRTLCRLLGVSRSGYYAWGARPESERVGEDRALLTRIEAIHRESREAYGAVKTLAKLARAGCALRATPSGQASEGKPGSKQA